MTIGPAIESFWDLAYENGDHLEHWESPHPPQELVAMVAAEIIPPGATVLDVGCGAGSEAIFLSRLGFQVIGIDTSAKAIEVAEARAADAGVEADFRRAAASKLPLADASIDCAIDRGCLHVIDQEERADYARELHRVLRASAPLLLRGSANDNDEEGLIAVDEKEIDRAFCSQGFSRGPIVPLAMVAESGVLAGNLAILRRLP